MMKFGLCTIPTHYTVHPAELGRWAEGSGFDSLWFGEHTHIPTSRETPFLNGGEMPDYYKMFLDPFVALTAAAGTTSTLKLGTSICLVPEHNPITLAKLAATLDLLSGGRFLMGFGAGWNEEELKNHGVAMKDRWKVTRERVLAMKEIWNNDVSEYHGEFVDFDPIWCWPKPAQAGGPPLLMGAGSKYTPRRIAEYCDGWIASDLGGDFAPLMNALRDEMSKAGRTMDELDLSIMVFLRGEDKTEARIRHLAELGFKRILMLLSPIEIDTQWTRLERLANFIRRFA